MIRYEYASLACSETKNQNLQQKKYRSPESWVSGLILTNWEFVISLWESRITSSNNAPLGVEPINSHYYLLQTANRASKSNSITNQFDLNLLHKSELDIAKLSSNQINLWFANYHIIEKLNKLENKTG